MRWWADLGFLIVSLVQTASDSGLSLGSDV